MIYCPECTKKTAKLLILGDSDKQKYKIVCENCGVATIEHDDLEWVIDTWAWLNSMPRRDDFTKPEVKPDPNNPYTDFAKEMSLLHNALKAEDFRDCMVPIMQAMAPIVWEKVEMKRGRELERVRRTARRYSKKEIQEAFAENTGGDLK